MPEIIDYNSLTSTPPGRVQQYLQSPAKGLLPYSCKLRVYRNDLKSLLRVVNKDLRWGAGVKVVLDEFQNAVPQLQTDWEFTLGDNHPDTSKITNLQSAFLSIDPSDYDKTIVVKDSMEGTFTDGLSIEDSWCDFYDALVAGKSVLLDLSQLRPNGTVNRVGLTATGAVGDGTDEDNTASFLAVYEYIANFVYHGNIGSLLQLLGVVNNTLRRGGLYKNGIITSSMNWENPHFQEYLEFPLIEIPGSHKKSAKVSPEILDNSTLTKLVVQKVAEESLFLEKFVRDDLHWNVCEGLLLPDAGTCLIWRINLGLCQTVEDIVGAYLETAEKLTTLHHIWRLRDPEKAKYSAPQEKDLQIGIDIMGLANMLSIWSTTYEAFNKSLKKFLTSTPLDLLSNPSDQIVHGIFKGMIEAMEMSDFICDSFKSPRLERLFTVEPAQSHSFQTVDSRGFTTCRAIFPPTATVQKRSSEIVGDEIYIHGDVETIADVGADLLEEVCENFYRLMALTGRQHGISYDLRKEPTEDWFRYWLLESPLQTKYYTEFTSADQSYLQKVALTASSEKPTCDITRKGECSVCAE